MRWFMAERALDATPLRVKFGQLQSMLAPVARYWWRPVANAKRKKPADAPVADPKWHMLSLDEWRAKKGGPQPRSGTLEVLGQTLRCSWMVDDHTITSEEPVVQPTFLPSATGSMLLTALEQTCRLFR